MGAFLMNHDFLNLDDPIVPPRTALIMQLAKELQPLSSKGWWREYRRVVIIAALWVPILYVQLEWIQLHLGYMGLVPSGCALIVVLASIYDVHQARNARRWKLMLAVYRAT